MSTQDIFGDDELLSSPPAQKQEEKVAPVSSAVIEKFLAKDENTVPPIASVQEADVIPDIETEDLVYTNEIPSLLPISYPPEFMEIYRRITKHYTRLPKLKYSDVYEELSELTVRSSETPTLQTISKELEKSQGSKERVSEIEMQVSECFIFKDRAVNILRESWYKFCDEKSADKRKGDAQYRLASFELDLAKTESLSKACIGIMKNLDSLQNVLSRKITNIQLQIKLMDIGRTSLPDFSFGKKFDGDLRIGEPEPEIVGEVNPDEPIAAKELDF